MDTNMNEKPAMTAKRKWHTPAVTMLDIDTTAGGYFHNTQETDYQQPAS